MDSADTPLPMRPDKENNIFLWGWLALKIQLAHTIYEVDFTKIMRT